MEMDHSIHEVWQGNEEEKRDGGLKHSGVDFFFQGREMDVFEGVGRAVN